MPEIIPVQRFFIRIHDEQDVTCSEILSLLAKFKNVIVSKAINFDDEQEVVGV